MTDADAAKVDADTKSDVPNASAASEGSNIDTPNINVKRGIGKPCAIAFLISWRVSLRQQALCDAHSYGEGAYTGTFDVTIDTKKEAKKRHKKRQQNPTRN